MRKRAAWWALWLPFSIALSACGAGPLSRTAQARGAADLDCPAGHVSAYLARGGVFVARGCGYWIEYSCFRSVGNAVCIRQSDPKQLPDS